MNDKQVLCSKDTEINNATIFTFVIASGVMGFVALFLGGPGTQSLDSCVAPQQLAMVQIQPYNQSLTVLQYKPKLMAMFCTSSCTLKA